MDASHGWSSLFLATLLSSACTIHVADESGSDEVASMDDEHPSDSESEHDSSESDSSEDDSPTADTIGEDELELDGEADTTGITSDMPSAEGPSSPCEVLPTSVVCPKLTIELGPWQRDVHYQVPLGAPPEGGWPAVLMFQGSFFSAELTWTALADMPFGGFHQTLLVDRLLAEGYAVITPETKLDGATFWDTNVPPWSLNWESSEDHALMLEIFAAIEDGTFGPIDASALFATGVSSGGYMSSRVALAYPGRFRAIAIAAGSYMTCSGPLCDVPELAPDHPPTLFLHGGIDLTVPASTAEEYHAALQSAGVDSLLVIDPNESHGWIPATPDEVAAWFQTHP